MLLMNLFYSVICRLINNLYKQFIIQIRTLVDITKSNFPNLFLFRGRNTLTLQIPSSSLVWSTYNSFSEPQRSNIPFANKPSKKSWFSRNSKLFMFKKVIKAYRVVVSESLWKHNVNLDSFYLCILSIDDFVPYSKLNNVYNLSFLYF